MGAKKNSCLTIIPTTLILTTHTYDKVKTNRVKIEIQGTQNLRIKERGLF